MQVKITIVLFACVRRVAFMPSIISALCSRNLRARPTRAPILPTFRARSLLSLSWSSWLTCKFLSATCTLRFIVVTVCCGSSSSFRIASVRSYKYIQDKESCDTFHKNKCIYKKLPPQKKLPAHAQVYAARNVFLFQLSRRYFVHGVQSVWPRMQHRLSPRLVAAVPTTM